MQTLIHTKSISSMINPVRYVNDGVGMRYVKEAQELFKKALTEKDKEHAESLTRLANWQLSCAYIHIGVHDDFVDQQFPSVEQVREKFKELMQ